MSGVTKRVDLTWLLENEVVNFCTACLNDLVTDSNAATDKYSTRMESDLELFETYVVSIQDICIEVSIDKVTVMELKRILSPVAEMVVCEIYEIIKKRKSDVRKSLIRKSLSLVNHLKGFDYDVKLAVSSSHLLDLSEPLCSLFLHTETPKGNKKSIHLDMNSEELQDVLTTLKAAQKEIRRKQELIS